MEEQLILSSVELIPAHSDGARLAFGLNLSVALSGASRLDDAHRRFLQPWLWDEIRQVQVFWLDPETCRLESRPVPVEIGQPAPRERLGQQRDAVVKRLGERLGKPGWDFGWRPDPDVADHLPPTWPGFVGDLSLQPWPLPQALNLSFFFTFDVPPGGIEKLGAHLAILAAPVLPGGTLEGSGVLVPKSLDERPEFDDQWLLEYRESTAAAAEIPTTLRQVAVRTRACRVDEFGDRGKSAFFDLDTLWIKKPPHRNVFDEDWLPQLEQRLADRLDLSQVLLDQLTENRDTDWVRQGRLKLGQAVIACLADIAAAEPVTAPDETTIADLLDLGSGFVPQKITNWKKWMVDVLPEVGQMAVIERGTALDIASTLAELAQLRERVLAPESLHRLIARRWSLTPGQVAEGLLGRDPGRFLRRANLGRIWSSLLGELRNVGSTAELGRAIGATLERYALARLRLVVGDLPGELEERIALWAQETVADVLPPDDAAELRPNEVPPGAHGLTFQLDSFSGFAGATRDDPDDHLSRIQGAAVLLRETQVRGAPGDGKWRCLNMGAARLVQEGQAPADGRPLLADEPVIVPSRLVYRNGLREVTLTYDNEPLTVAGPRSRLSSATLYGTAGKDAGRQPDDVVGFSYSCHERARMPGLKFGATYDLLPFLVANCGALPKALSNGSPCRLTDSLDDLDGRPEIRKNLEYRRRHGVGPVRVVDLGRDTDREDTDRPPSLPTIPERVHPRALELPHAREKRRWAKHETLAPDPLLMLARQGNRGHLPQDFSFRVCRPTTDIHTWDRWTAGEKDGSRELRKDVWCQFFDACGCADGGADARVPFTLDDPAVEALHFCLELLNDQGTELVKQQTLPCQKVVRDPGIAVKIRLVPPGGRPSLAPAPEARMIAVEVPEGALCRLSVFSLVGKTAYDACFAKEIVKGYQNTADEKCRFDPGHVPFQPFRLVIEAAAPMVDDANRAELRTLVWKQIRPRVDEEQIRLKPEENAVAGPRNAERDGVVLEVGLDLEGGSPQLELLRRHLYRAELWQQAWAWRGRPTAKHPDVLKHLPEDLLEGYLERHAYGLEKSVLQASPDPKSATLELYRYATWEARELGDRPDDDHVVAAMQRHVRVDAKGREVGRSFFYREPMGGPSGAFAAGHRRFAVNVVSRYEGLFGPDQTQVLSKSPDHDTIWRRLFIPCRWRDQVPVPRVKLVLPLTEAPGDRKTPGLLVVLDDPWHEIGGLAEDLEAEVMTVDDPNRKCVGGRDAGPGDRQGVRYWQMGPSPIVDLAAKGWDSGDSRRDGAFEVREGRGPNGYDVAFRDLEGPIGHSRERSSTSLPYFAATSFVLPPPRIATSGDKEVGDGDFSWWFCQVRFRRRLLLSSTSSQTAETRSSAWTHPYWVQYLPSFTLTVEDYFGAREIRVGVDGTALKVDPHPTVASRKEGRFEPYLVLTRQVIDVAGWSNQEVYVGVLHLDESTQRWVADDIDDQDLVGPLRVRFIEVQRLESSGREPFRTGGELWESIFDEQPDRERARIVRITRPIECDGK